MKVLVIGSGGREHALAWRLARDPDGHEVVAAPGNPGIAQIGRTFAVDLSDVNAIAGIAERERVDLTVIGPELPLSRGVADVFHARGLRIVGPTRGAAQLESSKAFAKAFMSRHGIPTARYRVCASAADARTVIASGELGLPIVVKADGLAAGKGVVVAGSPADADAAVADMMEARRFGEAGATVVLEECLTGPEVSFFALCDGRRAQPLGSAQDHKRIFDGDRGPNTGGMGAFAPSPLVDESMAARIMREVVEPVVAGLNQEGHPYRGFLYAGLMLTCSGPKVIEFNVRFGDPEAQVVVPAIEGRFAQRLAAAADGALDPAPVSVSSDKYVGIVVASCGYPESSTAGVAICGAEQAASREGVLVFHSGTRLVPETGTLVTAGGRVLTVVARGRSYEEAIDKGYAAVSAIEFEGMQYRRDIGRKALHV